MSELGRRIEELHAQGLKDKFTRPYYEQMNAVLAQNPDKRGDVERFLTEKVIEEELLPDGGSLRDFAVAKLYKLTAKTKDSNILDEQVFYSGPTIIEIDGVDRVVHTFDRQIVDTPELYTSFVEPGSIISIEQVREETDANGFDGMNRYDLERMEIAAEDPFITEKVSRTRTANQHIVELEGQIFPQITEQYIEDELAELNKDWLYMGHDVTVSGIAVDTNSEEQVNLKNYMAKSMGFVAAEVGVGTGEVKETRKIILLRFAGMQDTKTGKVLQINEEGGMRTITIVADPDAIQMEFMAGSPEYVSVWLHENNPELMQEIDGVLYSDMPIEDKLMALGHVDLYTGWEASEEKLHGDIHRNRADARLANHINRNLDIDDGMQYTVSTFANSKHYDEDMDEYTVGVVNVFGGLIEIQAVYPDKFKEGEIGKDEGQHGMRLFAAIVVRMPDNKDDFQAVIPLSAIADIKSLRKSYYDKLYDDSEVFGGYWGEVQKRPEV